VGQLEFISRLKPQDAIFGIANVYSSYKGCNLTIGYFLNDAAIALIEPKSCRHCEKAHVCTRVFAEQIITKYNQKNGGSKVYFLL
jgi:hypothetical protein